MQHLRQRLYLHKHPSSGIYGTNFGDKACKTVAIDSLIALKTPNDCLIWLRCTFQHHQHSSFQLHIC